MPLEKCTLDCISAVKVQAHLHTWIRLQYLGSVRTLNAQSDFRLNTSQYILSYELYNELYDGIYIHMSSCTMSLIQAWKGFN